MKKIIYVANIRMPTEKAHGIQIMKTCEALALENVMVELCIPKRKNHIKDDPFQYYSVKSIFKISKFWCIDLVRFGKIGFWIETLTFAISVAFQTLFRDLGSKISNVFYSRDEFMVCVLILLGKMTIWEAHMGHVNFFVKFIMRRNIPIVSISAGIRDLYRKLGANNIIIAPDGVDISKFKVHVSKEEARSIVELPLCKKIVLYTGHLYGWKGAHTLAEAASLLDDDYQVVFVGGTSEHVSKFKENFSHIKNIKIEGMKPHSDIPLYLKAADILVIPNSGKDDISRLYTSPMKMFEYMASETPIVASDLPSLREVLNTDNAYFFEADNAQSLADALRTLNSDVNMRHSISKQASHDILKYSWNARVQKIISFIYV